ncbi:hypothetical protein CH330_01155, partial [candidate division WOR-3 bacterium JGI_Cruoil_03_51_56]
MKAKFVLVLAITVMAFAGPGSDLAVTVPEGQSEATDAIGSPQGIVPSQGPTDFTYTVEWAFDCNNNYCVGITPVQDTLIWVSSGGHASTSEPNWIFIFDAASHALLDSFQEYTTTAWGYRDMCYDPTEDAVYAGYESNKFDKINATTHAKIATYTVTGSPTPSVVRALGFDGDSLYSGNFATSPICEFSKTGTNSHQVAPIPPYAVYGLAVDLSAGKAYATTADYSYKIIEYSYPGWTVLDSAHIPEIKIFGGCEMWRNDTFLLILGQCTRDSVFCFRLVAGAAKDVGVDAIVAPASGMNQGAVAPQAQIRNFGSSAQSNIPVYCRIDSAGTVVYDHNLTYPGPLAPGTVDTVTFTPDWNTGPAGNTYDITMFTALSGDAN